MTEKEMSIKENYTKNLKADEYARALGVYNAETPEFVPFTLKFFIDVLSSGRFQGSSLLEIGSGPFVHNIVPASVYFSKIVLSDYVEDNCEELRRWLRGESTLKQFLDAAAELEGHSGDIEAVKKLIEQRIKQRVKQVVRCDVLNDNIFLEDLNAEVAPPYDLIISSLCLEAAVPDFDGFVLALKRVNKLLRPGGGLILVGFLDGGCWTVEKIDYNYIRVSENDVIKALSESGFGKIDMKAHKFDMDYDYSKYYCLAAEKL